MSIKVRALELDKPTVLVTGSNRGIGFALVKNYAANGWNVIATCRSPSKAADLNQLSKQYNSISIEEMDVTDISEIQYLAKNIRISRLIFL